MDRLEQPIDFLDYLRGMAIIAVFLFHCLGAAYGGYQLGWNGLFRTFSGARPFLLLYPVTFGWLGVAIFIMISGFCSHLSFSRDGLNDLRSFYVRRFFRFPSSMRKCNTWRNGLMAGTLGGYGKRIQAHQS
jgi:peptidoglycan/LPS O-acetylase OafA/YrhL